MQTILASLIYLAAFLAVILAVYAVAQFFFSSRDGRERVNRRLTLLASGMQPEAVYAALVRKPASGVNAETPLLRLYDRFWTHCQQAGLEISPPRLLAMVAGGAVFLWLLAIAIFRAASFSGFVVNGTFSLVASFLLCGSLTWLWVGRKRTKRLRQLEEQMPVALDVINRAIRAGHPVISAVQLAGNEMGDPIGTEFGLIVDETTYGSEFREALMNFARRTGSPDAHFFAVSVGIQADTGGNLAEILEGLASVIRGRATLTKRVKALSSEGRASALLLSVLPILLISFMMLIHPSFYTSKFSDPIFWPSVGIIGILYLIGWVMIHRIINFRY